VTPTQCSRRGRVSLRDMNKDVARPFSLHLLLFGCNARPKVRVATNDLAMSWVKVSDLALTPVVTVISHMIGGKSGCQSSKKSKCQVRGLKELGQASRCEKVLPALPCPWQTLIGDW
jgi:hypothetical protein